MYVSVLRKDKSYICASYLDAFLFAPTFIHAIYITSLPSMKIPRYRELTEIITLICSN